MSAAGVLWGQASSRSVGPGQVPRPRARPAAQRPLCCRPCALGHGAPARRPPGRPPGGSCQQVLGQRGRCPALWPGCQEVRLEPAAQPLLEASPSPGGSGPSTSRPRTRPRLRGLGTDRPFPSRASSPSAVWTWWTSTPPARAQACVAQVSIWPEPVRLSPQLGGQGRADLGEIRAHEAGGVAPCKPPSWPGRLLAGGQGPWETDAEQREVWGGRGRLCSQGGPAALSAAE